MKALRIVSILVWGLLGLVFGVGVILAGVKALPTPQGFLMLVIGAALVAAAYGLHRLTCFATRRVR